MAYFWEGKIADVVYANPELDTVKILWKDEGDDYHEHYLEVNEEDDQFKALLEKVGYDDIDERTKAANEIVRQEFKTAFTDYAERMGMNIDHVKNPEYKDADYFKFFVSFNPESPENKERLFSLKLNIFEQVEVKNSDVSDKTKIAKTAIRKSSDPIEALTYYQIFRNDKMEIKKDDDGNIIGVYVSFQ